ncbi:MAG: dethiobiotin synthase [Steroidobacteraceae bacterium]
MKPLRLFVTGTDTGVGKTRVAVGLCHAFAAQGRRVAAMKPVASGCTITPAGLRNADALALQSAMTVRASYADVNPYAFAAPIAPHLAAGDAGTVIEFDLLDRAFERLSLQSDVLVVEGAGGWFVPLGPDRSFADLAAHWDLQPIVVVGLRLGCLNHALLTIEAIERRGLEVYGWVANSIDPGFERAADNVASLRSRIAAPCLAVLEHAPNVDDSALARQLSAGLVKP